MVLVVAGNHGLFFGVRPCIHGRNAGTLGLSLLRRGGKSQLTLVLMGPLPLSILGFEEAVSAASLSRRSCMAGGLITLGFILESGTSSLLFTGVFSGNFIGEIYFFGSLALLFAGGPYLLVPDGPGLVLPLVLLPRVQGLGFLSGCLILSTSHS